MISSILSLGGSGSFFFGRGFGRGLTPACFGRGLTSGPFGSVLTFATAFSVSSGSGCSTSTTTGLVGIGDTSTSGSGLACSISVGLVSGWISTGGMTSRSTSAIGSLISADSACTGFFGSVIAVSSIVFSASDGTSFPAFFFVRVTRGLVLVTVFGGFLEVDFVVRLGFFALIWLPLVL